eukprot:3402320-Heterocapsa_arctica.AAC.1
MVSPSAEIHKLGLTGVHPKFRICLTKRELGPLGLPSGDGLATSCSHAAMSGLWASCLIHPPMTLEERNKSGSSHEFGDTSAKVASGDRLAVVPP